MTDDDRDSFAAEYVLGTLDAQERAEAQALAAADPGFAASVDRWERRLGELNALVAPVEPPPELLGRVKARIAAAGGRAAPTRATAAVPAAGRSADVIDLTRRLGRWRAATVLSGAIAASIVALAVTRDIRPDLMPAALQPPVRVVEKPVEVIRTVEVPAPRPAQYVAVLQKDAASPAFLLSVDIDRGTFTVRTVGAERQAGKSYELWLVSDRFPAPRSLGLIGDSGFTVEPRLASYDQATINAATYAVSLEPQGGSPTGAPTGPVLYAGKLVQATPPEPPARTP
jgi:anti-sigma-K factor RskA